MNDFISHIETNSEPNSIKKQTRDFSLEDEGTKLQLKNNQEVFEIKIDKFYKPLLDQEKCDFLVYKKNKSAVFIELKGKLNLENSKPYIQLENTIIHFKKKLTKENIDLKKELFAIIASRGQKNRGDVGGRKAIKFTKKTEAKLILINTIKEKYNLNENKIENL